MAIAECLTAVRAALATLDASGWVLSLEAFRCLDTEASAHGLSLSPILELLDGITPKPWTFILWLDGAYDVIEAGEWVGIAYRYDRTKPEILAALGKGALRAARQQEGA